jgi:hypothetical protein
VASVEEGGEFEDAIWDDTVSRIAVDRGGPTVQTLMSAGDNKTRPNGSDERI